MKYIVLIYQPASFDPQAISPEEHRKIGAEYQRLSTLPNVKPGATLGKYQDARIVRLDGDAATLSSIPLAERGDVVSAFWAVEADSDEELFDFVAQIPAVKLGGMVEIRPDAIYW